MKLHLPNRLRKAVLACLAAAACLLPSTLASGTACLVGLGMLSEIALAAAERPAPQVGEDGWGTVYDDKGEVQEKKQFTRDGLKAFDTTREIILPTISGNFFSFGDSDGGSLGSLFLVWEKDNINQYVVKASTVSSSSPAVSISYKNSYGTGNGQMSYGWQGGLEDVNAWFFSTRGNDITIYGGGENNINVAENQRYMGSFDPDSVIYGKSTSIYYDTSKDNGPSYYSDNADGRGGAALHLHTNASIGDVSVSFINNGFGSIENGNQTSNSSKDHGGAIYVSSNAVMGNLTGDFIGNHIISSNKSFGGAIFNLGGSIGNITGNFIGNYVLNPNTTGGSTLVAGAISNGSETTASEDIFNTASHIQSIKGYFINNYVSQKSKYDVIAGAIANYGWIGSIEGVFIGNHAYSGLTANSGVIRNYDRKNSRAVIGSNEKGNNGELLPSDTVAIRGIFIGNYAQGVGGDASGGVMRNNGVINGRIEGVFVGNYVTTEGIKLEKYDYAIEGTYNYIRNNSGNYTRERAGMAYGGVLYNDLKTGDDALTQPRVGDIYASFYDNYASSMWGEAHGGAIFNQDGKLEKINGDFVGNHVVSAAFVARGGAIYNNTSHIYDNLGYIGEIDNLDGIFQENYARGKMAQGGAIFVANGSKIANVEGDFVLNYAESAIDVSKDSVLYKDIQDSVDKVGRARFDGYTLYPSAQGGALYVADESTVQNITANFKSNYVLTNGVGTLTKGTLGTNKELSDLDAYNEKTLAQGGAIYVNKGGDDWVMDGSDKGTYNILLLQGSFDKNYARNQGDKDTDLTNATVFAQGGAIYVADQGGIFGVNGSFTNNSAESYGKNYEAKTAQGGAIYLADSSFLGNINEEKVGLFAYNKAIVADVAAGEDQKGTAAQASEVMVQGGAIYVADGASILNVFSSFVENSASSQGSNTSTELVQGGAIYLKKGTVQNIGKDTKGGYVSFSGNVVEALGNGASLVSQDTQGGAIYVNNEGSVGDIYADFTNNSVTAQLDDTDTADKDALVSRKAQGGAVYLNEKAYVGHIYAAQEGFSHNSVAVTGDKSGANTQITVQGGALYVNAAAHAESIRAHFTDNSASSTAKGAAVERVGGGAIYIAAAGYIDNIGHKAVDENDAYYLVDISGNAVTASGDSATLTLQMARGGAILVDAKGSKGYSIQNIYTSGIKNNTVTALLSGEHNSNTSLQRVARGGAIYVSNEGTIDDIGAYQIKDNKVFLNDAEAFEGNSVTVSGGHKDNRATLAAQGGALFVDEEATVQNVVASFINNSVNATGAIGNEIEEVQGGAIYVANKSSIGNLGRKGSDESNNWAYIEISGNGLKTDGQGSTLKEQKVQGGAVYLDNESKMGSMYVKSITKNTIEAGAGNSEKVEARSIQGGAFFLNNNAHLDNIQMAKKEVGFSENSIKVSGGNEANTATLTAQGGALYLASGASIQTILADFTYNSINTVDAQGNKYEYLGGGAIYVAGGGEIKGSVIEGSEEKYDELVGIGSVSHRVKITNNKLEAGGKGSQLAVQRLRGGAIFVGSDYNETTQKMESGRVTSIYADITDNELIAHADGSQNESTREVEVTGADGKPEKQTLERQPLRMMLGGALFLADGGEIQYIYPGEAAEGFVRNKITVEGGNEANKVELIANGGAVYMSDNASSKGIMAGFSYNEINTVDALGNETETVGGGALYLAEKASVQAIGEKNAEVKIDHNAIKIGGQGDNLTTQVARGGAIYVSSQPAGTENKSIGEINADIVANRIVAGVGSSSKVGARTIQGGGIYLADDGAIGNITEGAGVEVDGKTVKGISHNVIEVTDGQAGSTILTAQGGALYVAYDSKVGLIQASLTDNKIVNEGTGNQKTYAQGGALYVAKGGSVGSIGSDGNAVKVNDNAVFIGKDAVKTDAGANADPTDLDTYTVKKYAMGGAIYIAAELDADGKTMIAGSVEDVYADFMRNSAYAAAGQSEYVDARVQGGAIFVADDSTIGNIKGNFSHNTAISEGQSGTGSVELVHGGAIDVARGGVVKGDIVGNFDHNKVANSEREARLTDGDDMHAKGGAIYLAGGASVGKIGNGDSLYSYNTAEGSGQVRAGAIFVSEAYVAEIAGNFLRNGATGKNADMTYGGAVRFDGSTIARLDSNFTQNYTTGTGGALSLTASGTIYEVSGDFSNNRSRLNGGAVDNMGHIGMRGFVLTSDEKPLKADYSNAVTQTDADGMTRMSTVRDSTDWLYSQKEPDTYRNQQGRGEYDGSFTGGFVNSNFLYNTIEADKEHAEAKYKHGAAIYTDKDLFITARKAEITMSGNKVVENGAKTRSGIYLHNVDYKPEAGDYDALVIYMVAQESGVLRIDDPIQGDANTQGGFVLRMRGYTDKSPYDATKEVYDTTGLVVMNNLVDQSYTVVDDVTLYIGYKPRTYISEEFLTKVNEQYGKDNHGDEAQEWERTENDLFIGDEEKENLLFGDNEWSPWLNVAGKVVNRDGSKVDRTSLQVKETKQGIFHQSDVFRKSFLSVRSGTVALTETTYGTKTGDDGKYTDMAKITEVFTEYVLGGLTAYGADYNYGIYGTSDTVSTDDHTSVADTYTSTGSAMETAGSYGSQQYPYRMGNHIGRYASFEFGMSFDNQYDLELANRYYYADRNGNPTEIATYLDEKTGERKKYDLYLDANDAPVKVVHHMAASDMLSVFAVWDKTADNGKGDIKWVTDEESGLKASVSKGRVTLNGLTVLVNNGWQYTKQAVNGPQQDGKDAQINDVGFNRDIYVQLINYGLVELVGNTYKQIEDINTLEAFYAKFNDEEKEGVDNGYHLLRLSDHFDRVTEATWCMKGSDIMADEIELATTVTKDDTVRIVGWRDHLAEWAEHQGSWDGKTYAPAKDEDGNEIIGEDGKAVLEPQETAGLYTGKKHFVLDQNVYYLNRDINLPTNPSESNHAGVGAQMWGKDLTIEGKSTVKELNLREFNMLSWIIPDQEVRLQSFTLNAVQKDHMQNDGFLTFDTMRLEDSLTVNNAGNAMRDGDTVPNRLTITGVMDINFTITTEEKNDKGEQQHGDLVINNTSKVYESRLGDRPGVSHETVITPDVPEPEQPEPELPEPELTETDPAGGETPELPELDDLASEAQAESYAVSTHDGATEIIDGGGANGGSGSAADTTVPTETVIGETVVHILGTVEHQDITHQGEDMMALKNEDKVYGDAAREIEDHTLGTWSIETGEVGKNDIRETFTTNTYLDTTTAASNYTVRTPEFIAFRDNALTMEGGAFNLGHMYKHRLELRHFYVTGGAVFVNSSVINMKDEVMGGIDVGKTNHSNGDAKYAGDEGVIEASATAATSGSGDGLIWLQGFVLEGTSDKRIVHVKFVDDGVGNAVKDGMGIANGAEKCGLRIMPDGDYVYNWEVTYNDPEAENEKDPYYKGQVGVRGMYTFRRIGVTPEVLPGPVTDMTGSYVTMMQVYNYSFEHADLHSANMLAAREQQLYANSYAVVDAKGKGSVVAAPTCPPSTAGLRSGMWLHTYASTEKMPLRNGPEVNLNMYGGLIGGDTTLREHRSGWASVWSFYGGYLGSTQRYDGIRIRQNGASVGATGTFYKRRFYTALTASVGVAQATSTGRAGSDNFDLCMGGIASRSGYSIPLRGGAWVLQPNVQLSYSVFNNLGYMTASGHSVSGKPTGVFQVNPFVKLIKNTDCTWKPYVKAGMVYNAFGKTSYTIDGNSLPSLSIKPYVEYSFGAQRNYNDRYTLYGEVTGRSGGRNGGEASVGIRRAW